MHQGDVANLPGKTNTHFEQFVLNSCHCVQGLLMYFSSSSGFIARDLPADMEEKSDTPYTVVRNYIFFKTLQNKVFFT